MGRSQRAGEVHGDIPPVYKIDLSLPPYQRYMEIARIYRDQMRSLVSLFDDLVLSMHPRVPTRWVHRLARLCLRRLFSKEETEEMRGISHVTGIKMYLLVAFNVLLDLLMGCTSGGVRAMNHKMEKKMLHFRTLDWGMDPLRDLVVQLEFVQSPQLSKVLATSVTYVGFVGVLTGVRKNLSVSLNFRPVHDTETESRYRFNHLLVLLGLRRSVSSLLRQYIVPEPSRPPWWKRLWPWRKKHARSSLVLPSQSLEMIKVTVPFIKSTAAYLIFCDENSTVTMEKDYNTAIVRSSSSFIVTTNHDQDPGDPLPEDATEQQRKNHEGLSAVTLELQSLADLIKDSNDRRDCMQAKWDKKVRQVRKARRAQHQSRPEDKSQSVESTGNRSGSAPTQRRSARLAAKETPRRSLCSADGMDGSEHHLDRDISPVDVTATEKEIIRWLTTYPITNETTHYSVIMDPSKGKVVWIRRYLDGSVIDGLDGGKFEQPISGSQSDPITLT